VANLTAKVRNGGKGVLGSIPMPPNKSIPDNDLKTVISWILSH
jgi:cytochrome c